MNLPFRDNCLIESSYLILKRAFLLNGRTAAVCPIQQGILSHLMIFIWDIFRGGSFLEGGFLLWEVGFKADFSFSLETVHGEREGKFYLFIYYYLIFFIIQDLKTSIIYQVYYCNSCFFIFILFF